MKVHVTHIIFYFIRLIWSHLVSLINSTSGKKLYLVSLLDPLVNCVSKGHIPQFAQNSIGARFFVCDFIWFDSWNIHGQSLKRAGPVVNIAAGALPGIVRAAGRSVCHVPADKTTRHPLAVRRPQMWALRTFKKPPIQRARERKRRQRFLRAAWGWNPRFGPVMECRGAFPLEGFSAKPPRADANGILIDSRAGKVRARRVCPAKRINCALTFHEFESTSKVPPCFTLVAIVLHE